MWHVTCAVFSRVWKVQCFSTLHCTSTVHRSNWGISSLIHIDMVMRGYGEFTQAMEIDLRLLREQVRFLIQIIMGRSRHRKPFVETSFKYFAAVSFKILLL